MGFGASAMPSYGSHNYRFLFLNSKRDYGFLFRTTKQSGGWMYGIRNELHTTNHSAILLAMVNSVDKHSSDTKSLYGLTNYIRHRGSGSHYGIVTHMYPEGIGERRALYNSVRDDASENSGSSRHMFGLYNYVSSTYRPKSYANYNYLANNNTNANDEIYGIYVTESGSGSAKTFGIYSKVDYRSGSYAGYFSGPMYINGDFNQSSDKRLKKNIKSVSKALDIINALKPTSYNYNELTGNAYDQKSTHYGFLAQDLEQVLPDLVSEVQQPSTYQYDNSVLNPEDTTLLPQEAELISEEVTYKAVRYIDLIAILTQALQEEDIRVKEHSKKIKEEKDKSDKLLQEVAQLKSAINDLTRRLQLLEACTNCGTSKSSVPMLKSMLDSSSKTISLKDVGYSVYPNPTSGQMTVEGPVAIGARLHLYDNQGRRVLDLLFEDGRNVINIGNLPPGNYQLALFDEVNQVFLGVESIILR